MTNNYDRQPAGQPLTLHGPVLLAARIAWVAIATFGIAIFLTTLPVYYSHALSLHGHECCLARHPADWRVGLGVVNAALGIGLALTILGSPVYRYLRVSDRRQREQTKWVMYVLVLAIAVFILMADIVPGIPGITSHPVEAVLVDFVTKTLTGIAFLLVPVGFGVAILRYRLWDVDVLINRTLVYGSLTVTLGACTSAV